MVRALELWLLTAALKWTLRLGGVFGRALGRRLPGELPVFRPPAVDPADMPKDEGIHGCTFWRR